MAAYLDALNPEQRCAVEDGVAAPFTTPAGDIAARMRNLWR
jgi:hypothetical protein